jgi:hypothetical protein
MGSVKSGVAGALWRGSAIGATREQFGHWCMGIQAEVSLSQVVSSIAGARDLLDAMQMISRSTEARAKGAPLQGASSPLGLWLVR